MQLRFRPYTLQLTHPFSIAHGTRSETPIVLTEIEHEGHIGYGEASVPPYYGENQKSVQDFLKKVDLSDKNPFAIPELMAYVDTIEEGNTAAKAAIDIALHDLYGKLKGLSLHEILGINPTKTPHTSFTIGMDSVEQIQQKVKDASDFNILKIKLGGKIDRQIVEAIRRVSDQVLYVDANQAWTQKEYALEMCEWLATQNVALVEQPVPKDNFKDAAWLTARSPLPIIADEAIQGIADVTKAEGAYHGINVKLMKSGGINRAYKMIRLAKKMSLKIMLGCMTETSCGISAAAQLSPMVDWADLDGNLLTDNDPFEGVKVKKGKLMLNNLPGLGLRKI